MSWPRQTLTDLLGIEHPIVQAPMAGASTASLAAAVSNAGALGGFGGTDSSPAELREVIRAIRRKTSRPFIINLYLDRTEPYVGVAAHEAALKTALAPAHAELHAGEIPDPIDLFGKFDRQIAVILEEKVPVLSSHFGAPDATVMRALKANGTRVIATATTVGEARQLASAGVDAIIAQGSEAGGHRGTFAAPAGQAEIGTMALVPQIVDAVSVPVIAAGGIMDGRGIAAALMLGAAGVQMGTAFVPCPETAVNRAYVQRLLAAAPGDAVLTDVVSGRPARLLRNKLVDLLEQNRAHRLAFPEQLSMTRNLRNVASSIGNTDFLPMWAGQGVTLARAMPAAELVGSLVAEAQNLLGQVCARSNPCTKLEPIMSPEQKTLVRETWQKVTPIADEAARLFYSRLFEIDATTRPLFKTANLAEQRRKLMQALAVVVQGLDHLDTLVPTLADLARRHAQYGVKDSQYDSVGAALLWTLEQGLGSEWTPEAKASWSSAYALLADVMRRAAVETTSAREA